MKKLTTSFFFLSVMALASLSASAAAPTNCWKVSGEEGGRILIIDGDKMKSANSAFALMTDLYYLGFEDLNVAPYSQLLYSTDGKPLVDAEGGPVTKDYQRITARIPHAQKGMYKNDQGLYNLALIKDTEERLEAIIQANPEIIKSSCIPVPGPGGRVGG